MNLYAYEYVHPWVQVLIEGGGSYFCTYLRGREGQKGFMHLLELPGSTVPIINEQRLNTQTNLPKAAHGFYLAVQQTLIAGILLQYILNQYGNLFKYYQAVAHAYMSSMSWFMQDYGSVFRITITWICWRFYACVME